jgi:hypothetical protein
MVGHFFQSLQSGIPSVVHFSDYFESQNEIFFQVTIKAGLWKKNIYSLL